MIVCALFINQNAIGDDQWSETSEFHLNDYTNLVKKDGEDFRILQLADMHVAYYIMDEFNAINRTLSLAKKAIETYKPDLLALTGDNVTGPANMYYGKKLLAFLDQFKIPYVMVMGNHDGEAFMNKRDDLRQEKLAALFETGKYSLFKRGPSNVFGTGNYGVNIVNEKGAIIYGLVMFDTNRDYLRPDQVAWYEWYIKGLNKSVTGNEINGSEMSTAPVKTLAFFHIPLTETKQLREEWRLKDPDGERDGFREDPSSPRNNGMFQKMKELGSTTHLFFGHEHLNRLYYQYEGIYFTYGLKTGFCGYHSKDRIGTTLITIKDDSSVTVEFKPAE